MRGSLLAIAIAALSSKAAFGATIKPFSIPWMNHATAGTKYATADHPGGVFVLEFYANFCGACNENADNVDALAEAYKDEPRVQVLDVSLDTSNREIKAWIFNHQPNHPVVKDEGHTLWNQVNEEYIPTAVVTDCHGDIKWRNTGVWDRATVADLKRVVDGLLAQTCE